MVRGNAGFGVKELRLVGAMMAVLLCRFSSMGDSGVGHHVQELALKQDGASDNATCLSERGDLVSCFEGIGIFRDYCDRCLATALPERADNCSDLNSVMCTAIGDCPCGLCVEQVAIFLNCAFQLLVRCPLNCTVEA